MTVTSGEPALPLSTPQITAISFNRFPKPGPALNIGDEEDLPWQ
jgi:hypothetical protein